MKADADIETYEAFSPVYSEYETLSRENYIDISRRNTIRSYVEKYLKPHYKILELNAGSGIDAEYFARKGYEVLATDISEHSGEIIRQKISNSQLENLRFEHCDFHLLQHIEGETFDHIFSNFGGLNCSGDLQKVFREFPRLLHPGGYASLVVMPKYYPWEMLTILKGNKAAFRRLKKNTSAIVGSEQIRTFYYSPRDIKAAFPKEFLHVATHNLGTFYPSAHFQSFRNYPNVVKALLKLDNMINHSPLMAKGIGDYFIITFQKKERP